MAEAIQVPPGPMTREEFHRWAEAQPQGRFELEAGEVVAMAPERASHADAKGAAYVALRAAVARAGVPCKAYVDGLAVDVDHRTSYEPDALVDCGGPMEGDPIAAPNPVVVVEVTSPSNSRVDLDAKFQGYFRVPSIMHYLIVHLRNRVVVYHARRPDGRIESAILAGGPIVMNPPGITITVEELFA
jgi:Uma2 family endonuclease